MITAKIDTYLEEVTIKCQVCGSEITFFREEMTPLFCTLCHSAIKPRPAAMLQNVMCRIFHHFGEDINLSNTMYKLSTKVRIGCRLTKN